MATKKTRKPKVTSRVLKQQLQTAKKDAAKLSQSVVELSTQSNSRIDTIRALESTIEGLKIQIGGLEQTVKRRDQELADAKENLRQSRNSNHVAGQTISGLEKDVADRDAKIQALEEANTPLRVRLTVLCKKYNMLRLRLKGESQARQEDNHRAAQEMNKINEEWREMMREVLVRD